MSQTDVNTQAEELSQNTNTQSDEANNLEENKNPQEEINTQEIQENPETQPTADKDSENEGNKEPTPEELDALSDDEFVEYMNSGKLPDKKPEKQEKKEEPKEEKKATPDQAKVLSKPDKETPNKTQEPSEQEQPSNINYEDAYKRIFAPFRANGKEITPRTVEDVISLMQMGANYTKKMQAMAPMRKIVESLSKAKVSEEDLNFLIDLHKGDKEAIKQLLKKNEIDVVDLDLDEIKYKPNNENIASDEDVNFAETISDINDSLPKIQEILNSKWDAESKKLLLSDPRAMRALHEEIQMGRFDKVQDRLEVEKTFGRYKDVPDVQAYIDLVNRMVAEEQATQSKVQKEQSKPTKPVPDKRKAAPTRGQTKGSSTLTAKDLFSMSDEEFERLSIKDLV